MDLLLPTINSPDDLKTKSVPQLAQLAREIRSYIISSVSQTGGHLAPSLGVVELTLVLHYIYNTPVDKIIWDVGHQAYAHKIITGRRELFHTIRQPGGISGFPRRSESEYDAFGTGHASTAISAALGMASARDLDNKDYNVLAIVGDGALTGGLAYEGLNNAGASGKNLVVVLNDNSMSISPNVGAIAEYLTNLISNPIYNRIKTEVWHLTGKLDRMGERIRWTAKRTIESLKNFIMPGLLFERLGFRYFGPIDGHNISGLIRIFQEVKHLNGPIFVHVLTKKGRGFKPAEENAPVFHGLGKFDPETGKVDKSSSIPTYTKIFGRTMLDMAKQHDKIVAISAAMAIGTGLSEFSEQFPKRFFDVGIAEGHSVTFAAGLAAEGYRPVTALYSSFLQRAYDNVLHDVALQKLPVIFAIDRAGLVGDDGPTHHGVFDLAFLRNIPNIIIMVPKDEEELRHMVHTALQHEKGPIAIRYPRGQAVGIELSNKYSILELGKAQVVRPGHDIAILAVGPLVYNAHKAADILADTLNLDIQVINMRFVKPLDTHLLDQLIQDFKCLITLEEGVLQGGFGSAVAEYLAEKKVNNIELISKGIPDEFIQQGKRDQLLEALGLSTQGILRTIRKSEYYQTNKVFQYEKELKTA